MSDNAYVVEHAGDATQGMHLIVIKVICVGKVKAATKWLSSWSGMVTLADEMVCTEVTAGHERSNEGC